LSSASCSLVVNVTSFTARGSPYSGSVIPVRANGQLGVAIYEQVEGTFRGLMIQILSLEEGRIASITGWVAPLGRPLFSRFGLDLSMKAGPSDTHATSE